MRPSLVIITTLLFGSCIVAAPTGEKRKRPDSPESGSEPGSPGLYLPPGTGQPRQRMRLGSDEPSGSSSSQLQPPPGSSSQHPPDQGFGSPEHNPYFPFDTGFHDMFGPSNPPALGPSHLGLDHPLGADPTHFTPPSAPHTPQSLPAERQSQGHDAATPELHHPLPVPASERPQSPATQGPYKCSNCGHEGGRGNRDDGSPVAGGSGPTLTRTRDAKGKAKAIDSPVAGGSRPTLTRTRDAKGKAKAIDSPVAGGSRPTLTHTRDAKGKTIYKCSDPNCGFKNKHRPTAMRHLNTKKHGGTRIPCSDPNCDKTFLREDARKGHEKEAHGDHQSNPSTPPSTPSVE